MKRTYSPCGLCGTPVQRHPSQPADAPLRCPDHRDDLRPTPVAAPAHRLLDTYDPRDRADITGRH